MKKFSWTSGLSLFVLALAVLIALFGPLVFPGDPNLVDLAKALRPPVWAGGTWEHWLGTDQLGRDSFLRLIHGARVSLGIAAVATLLGAVIGTLIGMLAGYLGGWADALLSRLIDIQLALPVIVLALAVATVLPPSVISIVVIIAVSTWVSYARVTRAEALVLQNSEFVALSTVAGLRLPKILGRHILPNVMPSVLVMMSMDFGKAIVFEASLSFLGLGVQPPLSSWGSLIADGREFIIAMPSLVLIPSIIVAVVALSANILGDWVRDRIDPSLGAVSAAPRAELGGTR